MASAVTRATIQKLSARIEELAERLDPSPKELRLVVPSELIELMGEHEALVALRAHYIKRQPQYARVKQTVFISTGCSRSDAFMAENEPVTLELLRQVRAQRQKPLAITWQPPDDVPLQ
jgi:hypothetical protein